MLTGIHVSVLHSTSISNAAVVKLSFAEHFLNYIEILLPWLREYIQTGTEKKWYSVVNNNLLKPSRTGLKCPH